MANHLLDNRWVQLSAGIVAMTAVANFQYSWTLFAKPLQRQHGWSDVEIQDALNLFFILSQTWLVPLEGYLADRFGPRRLLIGGGILAALGWVLCAATDSLGVLYAAQVLCGCGSGIVYSVAVGNALKWFPDRRGLAAGLTAAAFGAGSAATVVPIRLTITNAGYEAAFLWFGLAQGLVVVVAGLAMRFPKPGDVPPSQQPADIAGRDTAPTRMLRTPVFWLLYAMMTLGAIPGLLMQGQMAPLAEHFGVAEQEVVLLGITQAALPFALMVDRIAGGLTRPVFGWLSDRIGRESAMFLAFTLEGAALLLLILFPHDPTVFVLTSGLAFFGWGAVFSLFPAACSDLFGRKSATTNYGLLYTAKGVAAVLISVLNRLQAETGSWALVFALMIAFDWLAAGLALLVLRPLRARWVSRT
jgi:OFA family oxalate/formate antiporter-like MFS transporter